MQLALVGLSHHQAPIELRERLTYTEHSLREALQELSSHPTLDEVVILSTCNRVELYASSATSDVQLITTTLIGFLSRFHHIEPERFVTHLMCLSEQEATSHLLRVAAGLESLALGEAQILGQVRGALRAAQESGAAGSVLNALFNQALATGKRVRTETGLGRGAFSIGHAAVDLASRIFDDFSRSSVLILGAGKMSELTVKHLVESGVRFVVVANRTFDRAANMAARLGGQAIRYENFAEALLEADIVISSTAAPHPILRREDLQPIMRKRRGRPLFLIDIAVPRDIAEDVGTLENVYLHNIDDLQAIIAEERESRLGEVERAESLVVEDRDKFLAWYRAREAAPVIAALRSHLDQLAQERLTILRNRLGPISDKDWQTLETQLAALMQQIATGPIRRLKEESTSGGAASPTQYDLLSATCALFGLALPSDTGTTAQDTTILVGPSHMAEVTATDQAVEATR